jgi:hypothetical protein
MMKPKLTEQQVRSLHLSFDLDRFVNDVSDGFQINKRRGVRVSPGARAELVNSMRPHEPKLRTDLLAGKMTRKKLAGILTGVLEAAYAMQRHLYRPKSFALRKRAYKYKSAGALGTPSVDRYRVRSAMKWKCRYLGWC